MIYIFKKWVITAYLFKYWQVALFCFAPNIVKFGFGVCDEGEDHEHFHVINQSLCIHVDPNGEV